MPSLTERLFFRVAKRWIAGYTMQDAIQVSKVTNARKIRVVLNRLGEHTPDHKLIEGYTQEYLRLLDLLQEEKVEGCISVKPTQVGLASETRLYRDNLSRILDKAGDIGTFVWVDMENSLYTEPTLQVYKELLPEHRELGVCLQANLKRTEKDLKELLPIGGKIRLVKGAYPENATIAYKKRRMVDENFHHLMEMLFEEGEWFGVATHDEKLIMDAEELSKNQDTRFEFQLLMGIRDDLKDRLVGEGYTVSDYIPYGPEWLSYSRRRLRERKRNILLLVRSITG